MVEGTGWYVEGRRGNMGPGEKCEMVPLRRV